MNSIVKQYFDKSSLLTIKNKFYADFCLEIFDLQIKQDIVENDITSKIISGQYEVAKANIIAKQSGIAAGIEEVVYLINKRTKLKTRQIIKDGVKIKNKDLLLELVGNPLEILKFERTILNILQRMSGIATIANSLITKNLLSKALLKTCGMQHGHILKKLVQLFY